MSETRRHWDDVYAKRAPDAVSWFQAEPAISLDLIAASGLGPGARIIDVGAGASVLLDHLLDRGFQNLTALDVSDRAFERSRLRLADRAGRITWLVEDVTRWNPPEDGIDLWHDRAVFHFLVDDVGRQAYMTALHRALRPDGFVVMATFAPSGPPACSGLPVRRYSPEEILRVLGPAFELVEARAETHRTPGSASQDFTWCLLRRRWKAHL